MFQDARVGEVGDRVEMRKHGALDAPVDDEQSVRGYVHRGLLLYQSFVEIVIRLVVAVVCQ